MQNDDDLYITFRFVIGGPLPAESSRGIAEDVTSADPKTIVNGLTFISASNIRELDNLLTKEFHANPNLHKNANVELLGDFSAVQSSPAEFQWSWKWRAPKAVESRGNGWRNTCSVSFDMARPKLQLNSVVCGVRPKSSSAEHLGYFLLLGL